MPKKKLDIIEVEIHINFDKEVELLQPKPLSDIAKTRVEEIINEEKVIANAIMHKRQELAVQEAAIERVFAILKQSLDMAVESRCKPEPISIIKLTELYGPEININSLLAKLRAYIRNKFDNKYVLIKATKNKKAAYTLAQY